MENLFKVGDRVKYIESLINDSEDGSAHQAKNELIDGGVYTIRKLDTISATLKRKSTMNSIYLEGKIVNHPIDIFEPFTEMNPFKVGDKVKFVRDKMSNSFYDRVKYHSNHLIEDREYEITQITNNGPVYSEGFVKFEGDSMNHPFDIFELSTPKTMTTYQVEKEFILAGHAAACPDWKKKIENKFPTLFETSIVDTIAEVGPIIGNKTAELIFIMHKPYVVVPYSNNDSKAVFASFDWIKEFCTTFNDKGADKAYPTNSPNGVMDKLFIQIIRHSQSK